MSRTCLLIVEDQPQARRALREIAARKGFEVTLAATLAEASAALDPPPDGIILDLVLPDGRGEAVLQKVREERLPVRFVAVVTGVTDSHRLREVLRLGPDLLLIKPFDPEVLVRLCESELRVPGAPRQSPPRPPDDGPYLSSP